MKRILFVLLAVGLMFSAQAQEKWRTLTLTSLTNLSTETGELMPQFSVSLDYELAHDFYISSWNGMSYNSAAETSWFASQSTLDKRLLKNKAFVVGLGYLYSTNGFQTFVPAPGTDVTDELFLTLKFQYRIKL